MEAHNATWIHHNGTYDKLNAALGTDVTALISSLSIWQGLILLVCFSWGASEFSASRRIKVNNAPVHGYWSWLEPTWFFKLRYAKDAHKMIASGYHKVRLICD
jgi:hypothetical protein